MRPGPRRSTPPLRSLGELVRALPAAGSGGSRPAGLWKEVDARHGARPDWLLWRRLLSGGPPPAGGREDAAALALRALRAREPIVAAAALALLPALRVEKLKPQVRDELARALAAITVTPETALAHWLARSVLLAEPSATEALDCLRQLQTLAPSGWKPGRGFDLTPHVAAPWQTVEPARLARWLADAVADLVRHAWAKPEASLADWLLTAWQMRRDARPAGALPRFEDTALLLDAAAARRLQGEPAAAARLEVLALHLLPPRLPESLQQRVRAAAWRLAEAGLAPPVAWRVRLDDLPFPGDPPTTPNGMEAARHWQDPADPALRHLSAVVAEDPDWAVLRAAGVVLQYPLAALAWVAKRAQAHQVKKQHELLDAATRLAFRHQALGSLGRLLAVRPGSLENVVNFARLLRASLRGLPFLRDEEAWTAAQSHLRQAWGRLDTEIDDAELRFLLHETLQDRLTTTLRRLPPPSRVAALRHRHGRRTPSDLVRDLEADPRRMNLLEHQRRVELWELAAALRERPELAGTVWVSVVGPGDPASGRYSALVLGPRGQREIQGRLRAGSTEVAPLAQAIAEAVQAVADAPEWLVLATDAVWQATAWETVLRQVGLTATVARVPGWEWAYRVLREAPTEPVPASVLRPENAPLPSSLPAASSGCWLFPGDEPAHAGTRWLPIDGEGPGQRSLAIGAHAQVINLGPVAAGETWGDDLIALSLAQACRSFVAPAVPLAPAAQEEALRLLETGREGLQRLLATGNWRLLGLPPGWESGLSGK
jgi:hypothetical protein